MYHGIILLMLPGFNKCHIVVFILVYFSKSKWSLTVSDPESLSSRFCLNLEIDVILYYRRADLTVIGKSLFFHIKPMCVFAMHGNIFLSSHIDPTIMCASLKKKMSTKSFVFRFLEAKDWFSGQKSKKTPKCWKHWQYASLARLKGRCPI